MSHALGYGIIGAFSKWRTKMLNVSRRVFIANAAAATASRALAVRAGGAPNVTFGVLSDVHLERPGDEDTFLKALAYFRDGGADGVLVAGDIANTGRIEQLKRAALPIAFDGLNSNGTVYSGRTLRARFACGNAAVASVSCYVNGIRVAERVPVAGGEFSAVIPPGALTACEGEPNCVSFVAYDASGAVVTRNYSLVSKVSPATVLLLR